MAGKQSVQRAGKGGGIVGMLLTIAAATLFGALIFLGALPLLCLFLPALLALVLEREPGRPMTRTLLLFGVAGGWDSIAAFWPSGSLRGSDWAALADVHALVRAWLAQAAGCLLAEALGLGFVLLADRESTRVKAACEAEIAALKAEWSLSEWDAGANSS